jgi:hypothetical protein
MRVKMARLRAARKNRTHRENWFSPPHHELGKDIVGWLGMR